MGETEKGGETWFGGYTDEASAKEDGMRLYGADIEVRHEHFEGGFALVVPTGQAASARTVLGR